MTLYSDTAELIRLCEELRTKGNGGLVDEFLIEKFKLQKIKKLNLFTKFIRYTYFHSFGRKRINFNIRNDFFDIKEALLIYRTKVGMNYDCMQSIELAENYYKSLPIPKDKKWDRRTWVFLVLIPTILGLIDIIHTLKMDWILSVLAIFAIGLLVPLLGGLGASSRFSISMEIWWEKYWRGKLGINVLKTKIIDQTMEHPLSR